MPSDSDRKYFPPTPQQSAVSISCHTNQLTQLGPFSADFTAHQLQSVISCNVCLMRESVTELCNWLWMLGGRLQIYRKNNFEWENSDRGKGFESYGNILPISLDSRSFGCWSSSHCKSGLSPNYDYWQSIRLVKSPKWHFPFLTAYSIDLCPHIPFPTRVRKNYYIKHIFCFTKLNFEIKWKLERLEDFSQTYISIKQIANPYIYYSLLKTGQQIL